jgi:ankyrin repeat protein
VNAANPETGKTPLNEAAANGQVKAVRLLLSRGADASLADKSGVTPLDNAARLNYGEIVSALLPAQNAIAADLLTNAVLEGQSDIARLLIEHGADVNARGKSGSTPLGEAALKGRVELARLLLEHGARVDAVNRFGSTPLHDAALSGNRAVVELLLAAGAPVNARDRESGATPLYNAASLGHREIVALLLSRGADPNICTIAGSSPWHAAFINNFPETADLLRPPPK